jgi:hypothetical protein
LTSAAENRGSRARKPFGENLQGYGLAGAGGARDESVPVAKRKSQILVNVAFADQNAASFMRGIVGHEGSSNGGARRGFAARLTWPLCDNVRSLRQQILNRRRTP